MRVLLPATAVLLLAASGLATPAEAASAPTIKYTAPRTGSANGGTTVTIKGKHFTAVKSVKFGRTKGTHLHVISAKKLTVQAPKHAAGKVAIRVVTRHGPSAKVKADRFTFVAAPSVTKVGPASGTALGGTRVTVSGQGFTKVSSVLFGSTKGTALKVLSSAKLQITAPAHAAGPVDVRVRGAYGTSNVAKADRYTFGFSIKTVATPVPSDGNGSSLVNGMSCPAIGSCIAVGWYLTSGSELTYPLIETLSKGVWKPQVAPGTLTQPSSLTSVSCPTTTFCVAVGMYYHAATIATLSNGSWTAINAPLPSGATATGINDVSCGSAGSCAAVGSYKDSSNVERAFLDHFDGTAWTPIEAPTPVASSNALDAYLPAVSCATPPLCVAVGIYQTAPSSPYRSYALIERYAGSVWQASNAPLTGGSGITTSELKSVSCSGATCAAFGVSSGDSAVQPPFLTRYSGGVWTSVNAPAPAGSDRRYTSLEHLSCAGTTCRAGGYSLTSKGGQPPTVAALHGSTWTAAAIARPSGLPADAYGGIDTVSCGSSTFCVSQGDFYSPSKNAGIGVLVIDAGSVRSVVPLSAAANGNVPSLSCAGTFCATSAYFPTLNATSTLTTLAPATLR